MSITILASLALAHTIVALGPDELTIGDTAPVPAVEHWVRGKQPDFFAPGKTYVVEFWATWCPPCRASMPHLSELSEKYADKGVTIVGISDEKLETVTAFLEKDEWKQKARYTLATDPDRSTYDSYMKAAAQNGIPTSFIVKDGKVQWIGHPMQIDEPLAKVVDGTWNAAEFKTTFEPQQQVARASMKRMNAMREARKSGDWDAVLKMFDADLVTATGPAKAALQMQKFTVLLVDANRPDAAYGLGRELVAGNIENPMVLNQIAWTVLDNPKVKTRDLQFAMGTAKAAVEASKGKDAAIMDTLARAYWETGDKSMAIETQQKAIELAGDEGADEMKTTLKKYQDESAPKQTTGKTS